jgi:dynein heavy chain
MDVVIVAAMGPPGGGRNPVSERFMRHYNHVSITPFSDDVLFSIFQTILSWHFASNGFEGDVSRMTDKLVIATRSVFRTALAKLLPTPAKSHYTFNLRDFSRVIQGVCLSRPEQFTDKAKISRLWAHEVFRVFGDRLIDESDMASFLEWVRDIFNRDLDLKFDEVFKALDNNADGKVDTTDELRMLFFGDYMGKRGAKAPAYDEVPDMKLLNKAWEAYLDDYNNVSSKPMKLVMFQVHSSFIFFICIETVIQ